MKNAFEFAAEQITVNGKSFPARYEMAADGVNVFATVTEDGKQKTVCICIKADDELYPAALAAVQITEEPQAAEEAEQATEEPQAVEDLQATEEPQAVEEAEQATEEPQAVEEAEQTAEEPQAAPDPKAARGPVPEKSFVGQAISGNGWAIIFDGGCNRTRVIVCEACRDKLRGIIEGAGFYYSAALDSWNKKLTFRAYRAAQALAQDLTAALAS